MRLLREGSIARTEFKRSGICARERIGRSRSYRCLPLNIANAHGWFILNPAAFFAQWDGGDLLDSISLQPLEGKNRDLTAISHFGHGVLTFHINGLFRTEPGFDLFVTGPFNMLKDGIQPLTGVVETDWSPFTFTMNWRFTRKTTRVTFERDEPICMIFPVARGAIESVEPEFRSLEDAAELFGWVRPSFGLQCGSRAGKLGGAPREMAKRVLPRIFDAVGYRPPASHQSPS